MLNKNGSLTVRTLTAGGALPVPLAVVRIFGAQDENKNIVYSLITDEDGVTEKVTLPAPDRNLSEKPESAEIPYSVYNIEVQKEGYFDKKLYNLPVFDGVNSEQLVNMIPYSASADNYPRGNINADTNGYQNLD